MAQDPIDDVITLGGQALPVKGNVQANAASEFETGIKIGPPTNDQREHAFFLGLNDWSGGFGSRRVDVREELGTFWYPEDNSPETAFAGRVTLPARQTFVELAEGIRPSTGVPMQVGVPWAKVDINGLGDSYCFGIGDSIYLCGVDPIAASLSGLYAQNAPQVQPFITYSDASGVVGQVTSLVSVATPITSVQDGSGTRGSDRRVYAALDGPSATYFGLGSGLAIIMSLSEGATWFLCTPKWYDGSRPDTVAQLSVNWVYKKITSSTAAGAAMAALGGAHASGSGLTGVGDGDFREILIPTFNGGYRPLDFATGAASAPPGFVAGDPHPQFSPRVYRNTGTDAGAFPQIPVNDLFYWDKKLLGTKDGHTFFLVPRKYYNHLEEIDWSFDDDGYITERMGTKDPSHISGTTPAVPGVAGEEPWNVLLADSDGESTGTTTDGQKAHFIGTAEGPSGEPLPYLRAGRMLHVLDFYARQMVPIEVGAAGDLVSGAIVNGELVATDSWNVFAYSKGGVRNIGLPSKPGFGIPPNLLNATGTGTQEIMNVFASDAQIMAVVVDKSDTSHPATSLYRRNGLGWHKVGKTIEDFWGVYGFQMTFGDLGTNNITRAICVPGFIAPCPVPEQDAVLRFVNPDPPAGYALFELPNLTHQPTVGRDNFGDSGAAFVTAWYDGGFQEVQGTLLRMNCDAWSLTATETVKVEYRLNNDESAAWTQLVDLNGDAGVFNDTVSALYFDGAVPRAGQQFRTVQFRITLTRGADVTRSPELRALNVVYLKTPALRTSWVLPVDINRMIEHSKNGDTTFAIDGAPATAETIWAKLRDLWNTHTLLALNVPQVQDTIYVKITDMPIALDDFRAAVAGQGVITLQLIEPVGDQEADV